ncbi:hypothetical protein QQS21_011504 [Conoideocrella luteorostrata]|uniref:FAD-binding PCMH-type domain-containing protein n=1 Tax=Conoideocrella luteorostrata TaxID=1105319 RepID=A0AAJ0FNI6_9HYPO|nr:hypothetical protein QQS21_011504 [Conoideocrella luteorostrata]
MMPSLHTISQLCLLLAPVASGLAVENKPTCRCRPHEKCWPSPDKWNTLNNTIEGNLQAVRPVEAPCFPPNVGSALCAEIGKNFNNSLWRSAQPGAVQWTNWEAWPLKNQSCYADQPKNIPCEQGRVSLYSALVEKPEHIQAAVRFVAENNIRLAIKNSGHCFLGRSTAPESLQISTHKLKSISFTDNFFPEGATNCDGKGAGAGSAVTIGAGVQLKQLYMEAAKNNVSVVAGVSHTVGAAGGYVQGGGHSPLGNWKGMASDNALEFKGQLVTANKYKNKDLFWALRGGGGGTFGVVVSVTLQTFPDVPFGYLQFGMIVSPSNSSAYWDMMQAFHFHLPAVSAAGGAGYYFFSGKPADMNGTQLLSMSGMFFFINQTNQNVIETKIEPLKTDMFKYALPESTFNVSIVPRISGTIAAGLQGDSDGGGGINIVGSRMISRDFLLSKDGPARLVKALQDIGKVQPGVGYTAHVVAGGAAAKTDIDSAINPAWRKCLTHIAFADDWNSTTSPEKIKIIQDKMTNESVEILRVLEPDMGAYLNEADANEKNFQKSFWGSNYEKLYKVKQELDADNLFIARKGVGSEDWDDAGLCRIR